MCPFVKWDHHWHPNCGYDIFHVQKSAQIHSINVMIILKGQLHLPTTYYEAVQRTKRQRCQKSRYRHDQLVKYETTSNSYIQHLKFASKSQIFIDPYNWQKAAKIPRPYGPILIQIIRISPPNPFHSAKGFRPTVRTQIGTPMSCLKSDVSIFWWANDIHYFQINPNHRIHPCFRQ